MSNNVFFAYKDNDGDTYYYNNETQESTYDLPKGAIVYDPETLLIINVNNEADSKATQEAADERNELTEQNNSEKKTVRKTIKKVVKKTKPQQTNEEDNEQQNQDTGDGLLSKLRNGLAKSTESLSKIVQQISGSLNETEDVKLSKEIMRAEFGKGNNVNQDVITKIGKFKLNEFAKTNFQKQVVGGIFKKKKIKPEDMVDFSNKEISKSLLISLPKEQQKHAATCFKYILNYTKVLKCSHPPDVILQNLYTLINNNPVLIDEVYFQLIKQTNNNPDMECLTKTWEIFIIIATIFPPSKSTKMYVTSHILKKAAEADQQLVPLIRFTFIRFESRCYMDEILTSKDLIKRVPKIPKEMQTTTQQFYVSLYEILWEQKISKPKLPIPYIEHLMCQTIIEKGGLHSEGLFRINGNMKNVNELSIKVSESLDVIRSASVPDICSLLKLWFRSLQTPIIPADMIYEFKAFCEQRQFLAFTTLLPKSCLYALMYLVGFLKVCAQHKDETNMHEMNLAIVFGPNILASVDIPPNDLQTISRLANEFLCDLIENWDTSSIYPLPENIV